MQQRAEEQIRRTRRVVNHELPVGYPLVEEGLEVRVAPPRSAFVERLAKFRETSDFGRNDPDQADVPVGEDDLQMLVRMQRNASRCAG